MNRVYKAWLVFTFQVDFVEDSVKMPP